MLDTETEPKLEAETMAQRIWDQFLTARDKAWRAFGSDPDWQKLRATPGLSDAEIVNNISNMILRPLPFSPIR